MNNSSRAGAVVRLLLCLAIVLGAVVLIQVEPAHAASKYTCTHRPLYDRADVRWIGYRGADGMWYTVHPTNLDPHLTILSSGAINKQ